VLEEPDGGSTQKERSLAMGADTLGVLIVVSFVFAVATLIYIIRIIRKGSEGDNREIDPVTGKELKDPYWLSVFGPSGLIMRVQVNGLTTHGFSSGRINFLAEVLGKNHRGKVLYDLVRGAHNLSSFSVFHEYLFGFKAPDVPIDTSKLFALFQPPKLSYTFEDCSRC